MRLGGTRSRPTFKIVEVLGIEPNAYFLFVYLLIYHPRSSTVSTFYTNYILTQKVKHRNATELVPVLLSVNK